MKCELPFVQIKSTEQSNDVFVNKKILNDYIRNTTVVCNPRQNSVPKKIRSETYSV